MNNCAMTSTNMLQARCSKNISIYKCLEEENLEGNVTNSTELELKKGCFRVVEASQGGPLSRLFSPANNSSVPISARALMNYYPYFYSQLLFMLTGWPEMTELTGYLRCTEP